MHTKLGLIYKGGKVLACSSTKCFLETTLMLSLPARLDLSNATCSAGTFRIILISDFYKVENKIELPDCMKIDLVINLEIEINVCPLHMICTVKCM